MTHDYSKPTPCVSQLFHLAGRDAYELVAHYETQRQLRRAAEEEQSDG